MRCWAICGAQAGLDNDPPGQPRIGAQPLLRAEMQITLNRESEPPAPGRQLGKADPADFRPPQAQVAKTKAWSWLLGLSSVSSQVAPAFGVHSLATSSAAAPAGLSSVWR